jgi:hypothetical protein
MESSSPWSLPHDLTASRLGRTLDAAASAERMARRASLRSTAPCRQQRGGVRKQQQQHHSMERRSVMVVHEPAENLPLATCQAT